MSEHDGHLAIVVQVGGILSVIVSEEVPPGSPLAVNPDTGMVHPARPGEDRVGRAPTEEEAQSLPEPEPGQVHLIKDFPNA